MKILFIKLSAIGDVVQTLPALEAVKHAHPRSSITWVVEEAAAGILEGHPLIDRLLISRRKAWLSMLGSPTSFRQGLRELREFISLLRATRYDIAVDFQGLLKSGIVMGLARSDRKIGFGRGRECSHHFLNEKLPPYDIERHAVERYLDIARHLGAKDPRPTCTLPLERERALVSGRLRAGGMDRGVLIVINPVARWKTKLWREERFAELADRMISERGAVVVFTGSPADRASIERIRGMMTHRAESWAGETTLKELAALASLSGLFITTDTGPMHLAAAAGAKVIALFGPTAPWRTGPYGEGHRVVRGEAECAPCFQRECDRVRCMDDITVDAVLAEVDSMGIPGLARRSAV